MEGVHIGTAHTRTRSDAHSHDNTAIVCGSKAKGAAAMPSAEPWSRSGTGVCAGSTDGPVTLRSPGRDLPQARGTERARRSWATLAAGVARVGRWGAGAAGASLA